VCVCRAGLDRVPQMSDDRALDALRKIAHLNDQRANSHLEATGSYGKFDEPASVQTARAALLAIEADPDFRIPYDVKIGPITFKAGCKLQTFIHRAHAWYRLAQTSRLAHHAQAAIHRAADAGAFSEDHNGYMPDERHPEGMTAAETVDVLFQELATGTRIVINPDPSIRKLNFQQFGIPEDFEYTGTIKGYKDLHGHRFPIVALDQIPNVTVYAHGKPIDENEIASTPRGVL